MEKIADNLSIISLFLFLYILSIISQFMSYGYYLLQSIINSRSLWSRLFPQGKFRRRN